MSMVEQLAPPEGQVYRIAEVERMTGIGTHTLRAWERRYGLPAPARTEGGQRLYTPGDVDTLRRVRALVARGVPVSKAAESVRLGTPGRESATGRHGESLLAALLSFDEAGAAEAWSAAFDALDILSAFDRVVVPLLREVGDGWHAGRYTVAQEHFATNFVRGRLDNLARQVQPLAGAPVVLLACLEGEQHEIGLLMLAVLLRFHGQRVIYLGRDVPSEVLIRTVEDSQPAVLAVSATTSTAAAAFQAVAEGLAGTAPATAIVYGGPGFPVPAAQAGPPRTIYGGQTLAAAASRIIELGRRPRIGGRP